MNYAMFLALLKVCQWCTLSTHGASKHEPLVLIKSALYLDTFASWRLYNLLSIEMDYKHEAGSKTY